MNDFITLWNSGRIPIHDGIYFPDGVVFDISIRYYPSPTIIRREPFTIDWRSIDASWLTSVGETFCLDLFEFGKISLGEGAFGSEGFFAYFNSKNELQWVCYSECCNPFVMAEDNGNGHVIIDSSADYRIAFDVANPQDMYIL